MGVICWPVTLVRVPQKFSEGQIYFEFRITSPSLKSAVDQQKQAMRRNSDNDNGANNDANIGSDANNAREAEIVHAVDAGDGAIDAFGEGRKIGQCPNCSWHCNVCTRRRNENMAASNAAVGGKEVATATQNIESLEVASATEQIELMEAESIPQNLESFEVASATQEVLIMETASAVEKAIETDKTRGISAGLEEEFERGMELGEDFTATQFSNVSWSEPRVTVSPAPMFHNDEQGVEDGVLKYLVCQTDVKSVVGGKMSGQGPFFMGIPDSVVSAERRLQMGDTVVVSKFEWKEGFERLSYDLNPVDSLRSWYVQGRINVQAVAIQVEVVRLVIGSFQPGFVTDLKRYRGGDFRSATVISAQMLRPQTIYSRQLTEISPGRIMLNQLLHIKLAKITSPQEWWMGENYILPLVTPFQKGNEIRAHAKSVVIGAKESLDSFCFPLNQFSVRLMGAAAAVQRSFEMDKLAKQTVNVQLVWQRPEVQPDEVQTNLKKAQRVSFEWLIVNKSAVADFLEAWEEDTPVEAKVARDSKAQCCAVGRVIGVSVSETVPGSFMVNVKMFLSYRAKKGYDRGWEDWESILDQRDSNLKPIPNYGGLPFREEAFELSVPSDIAEGQYPVSKILKTLMGMGEDGAEQRPTVRLSSNEIAVGKLNEDQRITHGLFLDDKSRVIFMQAPAGTGKSVSVAACIASVLKKDRDAAILAVSPLNVAVCELVKDTMESLSEKVSMLALFSGQGKGRYMDRIRPLGDNLLVEAVQRDGNVPSAEGNEPKKWSDNKTFKQYVDDFNTAPRRARERSTTAALLKQTKYRVYFMTLALAEELALDLGNVTYVLVDECGQATLSAVLSILTQFRSVKKILLTGDKQQLRVHLPSQMTVVRGKFGFESILEVLETAKGIDRTVLSKCYRSHSAIVKCLDVGVYSPAGDRLVPGRPDIEMSSFLNFMGPRIVAENCPIILIHQKSSAQMENISFSSHNPEQRETALGFLGIIQGTFPGLIQVVCFYQAERKHMVSEIERRRWPNVKVSTVDSIQSQEAELVLVITTRSAVGRSTEADTGKEFWADCARTTVALSRPKFGLVIIGDLSLIWHKGTVWRRFIDETLKMTVAVTPEYLNLISNPFPSRVGKFIAKRDGTVPMAFEFYAERDSTLRHESGFMPFTTQANAFPPISSIHAQPPAFSHGMMIIDTSVRPPPINMIAGHTMPMPSNHPGPSARMAPYPPQHLPRTSYAEAAQQAPSNTNNNRRIDVKCYRCGKIGHFSKRCRT
ncbi:hypothetical protein niasHT_006307 [Heterodera trifolii]|uniref:CCHC-type domain-containing protein n=1 Tax=Heterodera trifolii TaxID=157864 RepID=A0ABD2LTX0_9BILA